MNIATEMALPIVAKLSRSWRREEEAIEGMDHPQLSIFWAVNLGMVERRRRWPRKGYWLRLSGWPEGMAEAVAKFREHGE